MGLRKEGGDSDKREKGGKTSGRMTKNGAIKIYLTVVVSCCYKMLVSEIGDSSGTQRKGNVRR
jgi:hypothetical protein